MKLNEKLIMLRRQQGLTQDELAQKVGVTRQAVSKWERGVIAPSTVNLITLGQLYGIPLDELVNGEPQGEEPSRVNVAVADPPDPAPSGRQSGLMRLAGGAVLAVCLLLMTVASIITIGSFILKEPETPKDEVVRLENLDQEYIDPAEIIHVPEDKCGIIIIKGENK